MLKTTYSKQVDRETFDKMKDFYLADAVKNENENLAFFAKNNNCSISGYKSLKVVFQGDKALTEASSWFPDIEEEQETGFAAFPNDHAGSDEVGTGDFFGPIIVTAVYVKKDQFQQLIDLGVKDSKKLTDDRIRDIGSKLIHMVAYSSLHLNNSKYNQLISSGFNMNKLKAFLHNKALLNLKKKVKETGDDIKCFVIDQFTPEKLYYSYLNGEILIQRGITFATKGESKSLAVACASIISRYSFLIKLARLEKIAQTSLPKGAGAEVDKVARNLYEHMPRRLFNSLCKMNFKNYEKLQ